MAGRRLELGFEGGTVMRVSLEEDAVARLTGGLGGDGGWINLPSEGEDIWVNTDELVYVRVPQAGPQRIGFSGS